MTKDEMRALRELNDMTQEDLAYAIGMARQSIGMMERGETPIAPRTAYAVQQATGPVRRWAECRISPALAEQLRAILSEAGKLCEIAPGEEPTGFAFRMDGELAIGLR